MAEGDPTGRTPEGAGQQSVVGTPGEVKNPETTPSPLDLLMNSLPQDTLEGLSAAQFTRLRLFGSTLISITDIRRRMEDGECVYLPYYDLNGRTVKDGNGNVQTTPFTFQHLHGWESATFNVWLSLKQDERMGRAADAIHAKVKELAEAKRPAPNTPKAGMDIERLMEISTEAL